MPGLALRAHKHCLIWSSQCPWEEVGTYATVLQDEKPGGVRGFPLLSSGKSPSGSTPRSHSQCQALEKEGFLRFDIVSPYEPKHPSELRATADVYWGLCAVAGVVRSAMMARTLPARDPVGGISWWV